MTAASWVSPLRGHARSGRGRSGRGRGAGRGLALRALEGSAGNQLAFWMTALLLGSALMFGGASRENALQLVGLELLSLPVITAAVWRLYRMRGLGALAAPVGILTAIVALPMVQLIPIPFELWRTLPGRAEIAEGLVLAGAAPRYLPLSLTPQETYAAALTLLVPAGVFFGASACTREQQRLLAGLVVMAAGVSLLLGLLQVTGGPESSLRFYPTTNPESAVGLFANRNHQAIFLLIALPWLALWAGELATRREQRLLVLGAAALGLFGVILIGVAITRSRAGLLLTLPAVAGALLVLWKGGAQRRVRPAAGGLAAVAAIALTAIALFALQAILERFAPTPGEDYRVEIWPYVTEAGNRFAPLGAGFGSFEQVYRAAEPLQLMGAAFVNHAHNEYLQLWLEGGAAGLALGAAAVIWLGWRSLRAWGGTGAADAGAARAASLVLILILLHSIVDYPARTPAIMAVLALSCAALARSQQQGGRRQKAP